MPYISSAIYLKDVLSTDAESLSSFLSSGGPITVGNVDTKINLGDLALINRDAEIRIIRDGVLYKISALNLFKKKRNNIQVKERLERLKKLSKNSENIIPPIIKCIQNDCTLGEISDSLRSVFGEY